MSRYGWSRSDKTFEEKKICIIFGKKCNALVYRPGRLALRRAGAGGPRRAAITQRVWLHVAAVVSVASRRVVSPVSCTRTITTTYFTLVMARTPGAGARRVSAASPVLARHERMVRQRGARPAAAAAIMHIFVSRSRTATVCRTRHY